MITPKEYEEEIKNLAEEAMDQSSTDGENINDLIHSLVDEHRWVVYYGNARSTINLSNHPYAILDSYSNYDLGHLIRAQSLEHLEVTMAYWAMSRDIEEQVKEIEEEINMSMSVY